MGKYLLPALLILFLALNVAAYALILDLDGSTVSTKHAITPREMPQR